ncbi:MAG: histidine phosphatase family protein [Hyphomicrobiaceae bacterium]|nr:histidine phosphatase family protein [Hyphomicrobiaceae bacterium]MCC0024038.1 histidine phosphatase family protein [Hyphomicrobiaceae bacterium]
MAFAAKLALPPQTPCFSSAETKAVQLAEILQPQQGLRFSRLDMNENDRSSTGYLRENDFDRAVARFFSEPGMSFSGWETASDAQRRIVAAADAVIESQHSADLILFAGHGGVGTLLKCALGNRPISQAEDQRSIAHSGGGNFFVFDLDARTLLCDFTPIERFRGMSKWLTPTRA